MKLNNNGWGYRIFIICLASLFGCLLVANHYLTILIGNIK